MFGRLETVRYPQRVPGRGDRPSDAGPYRRLVSTGRGMAPFTVIVAWSLLVSLFFWPGHMSADSLAQFGQVIQGSYTDQHAPILQAIWTPLWDIGVGPGLVLLTQIVTFVLGCYLLLRCAFGRVASVTGACLISATPPVVGFLGVVGRDTWFAALSLLAFGLTAAMLRSSGSRRHVLLGVALTAAYFALAARQNAAPTVVVAVTLVLAPTLLAWPRIAAWAPRRRLVAVALAGVAATLGMMTTQVGIKSLLDVERSRPQAQLFLYDLAALSRQDDKALIPREAMRTPTLEAIEASSNQDSIVGLLFLPNAPAVFPISDEAADALQTSWWRAVRDDPLGYLETRWEAFLRQISVTRSAMWAYHPVIDPNSYGLQIEFPSLNNALKDYESAFTNDRNDGGVLFRVWIYLALCAAAAVMLMRRRRSAELVVVGGLGLSGLLYQAGLFFGTMGTQYRFEYVTVACGMIAAAVAARTLVRDRRTARVSEKTDATQSSSSAASGSSAVAVPS